MNRFHLLFLLSFLFACKPIQSHQTDIKNLAVDTFEKSIPKTYKVVGVKDGDTIVLLDGEYSFTVRFAHIDCPEKKQPFGNKAKQFVSDACFGKSVSLIHQNIYDRNKRLIAEIILDNGENLNKSLVINGLAWHFKKYSTDAEYAQLEIQARANKIGIWSEPNPIAPWNWRRGR